MEFWLEVGLIIIAIIIFSIFLRWIIVEWKNRLLLGGYFKQNAEVLRETARQQSRAQQQRRAAARANLAPRNLFVHIPPPEFEVALKMKRVFYIDVEDQGATVDPPSYDEAIQLQSIKIPDTFQVKCTSDKARSSDEIVLNVQNGIGDRGRCSTSSQQCHSSGSKSQKLEKR